MREQYQIWTFHSSSFTYLWNYKNCRKIVLEIRREIHFCVLLPEEGKDKRTAIPLQAWTGPLGSRGLKILQFLGLSGHEDGKVVSPTHTPTAFTPPPEISLY